MIRKILISALFALFTVMFAAAQQQEQFTVEGTVFDETSEPLAGANVFIVNTTRGVSTDAEGKFSIKAPFGATLAVSFVGYEQYEMVVKENVSNLEITLKPSSSLEEVVVTAFGATQRKISLVGAVTTVAPKELQVPATSMASILGGRVAGIINLQQSGEPGQNLSEFWVRGIGTFGANASALVLIDGLEGDLNSIDPADVESFSVLKDASATAVYGVRGANGVVLVTTKRGVISPLKIMARANATFSTLTKMPEYLRAYEYASLLNEALEVRGAVPRYTNREMAIIQYGLDRDIYPDVDWQDEVMKDWGLQHTYYLSGQGGGDIAKYFVSLNMSNENSAYKMAPDSRYSSGVGYNTYSFRMNLDLKLTSTTNLYFGTDAYLTHRREPGLANTDYIWQAQAQLTPLLMPTVYSTGELPAYGNNGGISPYVIINHTGNKTSQTFTGKMTMSINQDLKFLLDGLKVRVQAAYDNKSYFDETRFSLPELYWASGRNVKGELLMNTRVNKIAAQYGYTQRQYRKYHLESTLTYEKMFNTDHRVSGLVYYYMSDDKDTDQIGKGKVNLSMSAIPKRYQGISSRLSYGFRDTYFLDVNFGFTGSENFQAGRRFGFFPSIAGGWAPTQYEWTKETLSWLTFLKIRGSYGTVGNDRIASDRRFPYLTIMDENAQVAWATTGLLGIAGITESGELGADNLMWERAIKADVGVDGQLFDGKLAFTVDWFQDRRNGIFQLRATIPDYVGLISMPYGNVGEMKSWGSDGNISFMHSFTKDIDVMLRANYTYSRNEIINWEQALQPYDYLNLNGYTNNAHRGYIAMGLFRDAQDVASSPVQSFGGTVLPGDIKYKDVNGDGLINTDDKVPLSDPTYPAIMYGFGGEIRYKAFTLGVLFKGRGHTPYYHVGQYVDNTIGINGMGYVPFYGGDVGNVLSLAADPANRWVPYDYAVAHGIPTALAENPNARFPRLSHGRNSNNSELSTFWKGDAWYLRLQEVTLNYRIPEKILNKLGIASANLQFVGNNLYVWDGVKLFDPEQAHKNGLVYPIPKRYTVQLYINF
jgi:TonB-linked SusC/RagA family outer membrane protein